MQDATANRLCAYASGAAFALTLRLGTIAYSSNRRDHRCVVRWLFPLSRHLVHLACGAACPEFRRHQNVIDTQPRVTAESEHSIIPPRVKLFRLLELAKGIGEAEF